MATPPYPKSRSQGGNGHRNRRDVRVSLQRITEMTSAASGDTSTTTASKHGLTVLGTTLTSSATEETTVEEEEDERERERRGTNSSGSRNGGFESSNTLSEYLNAGDLYDSLKGWQIS